MPRLCLTQQRRAYADDAGTDDRTKNVPSNHLSTAQELNAKQVRQKLVARKRPPKFESIWADLQEKLGDGKKLLSAEESLKILKIPLTTEYDNETNFGRALFEAVRQCLSPRGLKLAHEGDNVIVLKIGNTEEYAVGLARHVSVAKDLKIEISEKSDDSTDSTSSVMRDGSMPDHATCLFQKGSDNRWRVKDCFSVVKLKLDDASCHDFRILNERVREVSLESEHGALGQAMLYTLAYILPYHARRGVLGDHLLLAIVAGKRTKPVRKNRATKAGTQDESVQDQSSRLRWVSGRLEIPEACGSGFRFCVEDFGHFHNESDDREGESVKNALSVYLNTLLFGLSEALKVHNDLVENKVRPAVPASGRSLLIGKDPLHLQFCASPIPGANTIDFPHEDERWIVSQGELFAGRLNVYKTDVCSKSLRVDFLGKTIGESKEVNVIAKVTSRTVHPSLINPFKAFDALKELKRRKKLKKEIGSVLYKVVRKEVGLVSIMADLSKHGYRTLKPKEQQDKLAVLWAGFTDLVKNVLLPMAEINIIHPDIRPGFDVTSNILCKLEDNGTRAIMKMIDYESLVLFEQWEAPRKDGRYVTPEATWNATTFVWWQCICLAYTWHNEFDANALRQGGQFEELVDDFIGSRSNGWLQEYAGDIKEDSIDAQCVKATLAKLGKRFEAST